MPAPRRVDPLEQRVIDALEALQVGFEVLECDPEFADTAAFCDRYGIDPSISANTILVASRREPKRYAACVVLATTRLDVNGMVRRRLGVNKASFASAEETMELTGMMIGGVTPLALPDGLPVWVDGEVVRHDRVVVGGGTRSMKLLVETEAFRALRDAEIVDELARPVA